MMRFTRRDFLQQAAYGGLATALAVKSAGARAGNRQAGEGAFQPTWESLAAGFKAPDWFRDAKLGMWSHWGPQCAPEFGDWYGRNMYLQGHPAYEHHVKTYGHPTAVGFMEMINRWKAQHWDPEGLIKLYKAAGAKYFVAMACHHDNFDNFASRHHAWNATRVGPKRDIVGTWAAVARKHGLRFGLSNHTSHAWHWYQTAYGYDATGPLAGVRYDAFRLTKRDGVGKWWEGLDPQELYTGPNMVVPDGIADVAAMQAWHDAHTMVWDESVPANNRPFAKNWLLRANDMVDRYRPDLVYYDNTGLPLENFGLEATAHYYNQSLDWHGTIDVLATGKELNDLQRRAVVADVERGFSDRLHDEPWQTCTCIGDWHYDRGRYESNGYMSAKQVIQRLTDVVSKNGCLLLSIPQRSDGTIDELEERILAEMAAWMAINGEAIFASRPWRIYGEGPTELATGKFSERNFKSFTAGDVRFTVKDGMLYALGMEWPEGGTLRIRSLRKQAGSIQRIEMVGGGAVDFVQDDQSVRIAAPPTRPSFTPVFRIGMTGV